MRGKTIEYRIEFAEMKLSAQQIARAMGYRRGRAPQEISRVVERLLKEAEKVADVRGGIALFDERDVSVGDENLKIREAEFDVGKIIAGQLCGVTSAAVFVCTAGAGIDAWISKLMQGGEMLDYYTGDAIGSAAADKAAEIMERKVDEFATEIGRGATLRFSPGYCGWKVDEQRKLFSILPNRFCGVELNESALMSPLKSVSGIVGIGAGVEKGRYPCESCDDESCRGRQTFD